MLKELKIENYAIIDHLEIDFATGLNTITGETGAGKSILLGALGLISGGRVDSSIFADNAQNCVIETVFKVNTQDDFFEQNDISVESGELTIRRTIAPTGRSRAFVNDEPVSMTLLKELSDRLVDIHSQHQTLLLSRTDYQTQIVDSISGYSTETYKTLYHALRTSQKELKSLTEQSAQTKKRAEYLDFQISQITEAEIKPSEISDMEARAKMLDNVTEIATAINFASKTLQNDDSDVVSSLKSAHQTISKIITHFPKAEELAARINSIYLEAKDLASELESIADNIEINPSELEAITNRLDKVYSLMHKHSVDNAEGLMVLCDEMQAELDDLTDIGSKIEKMRADVEKLTREAVIEADKISKKRHGISSRIEKEIIRTLRELGIKEAQFSVNITDIEELSPTGRDKISMLFSANAGKAPQSIENVASGGEMSRVMLAIKGLMSKNSELPTIIFDEIDTGVSGVVAHKMGEIIESMSHNMQVLNITHLPQVASKGEAHFLVHKDAKGTHIKRLTQDERIAHIATMLSGSTVTEAAQKQAIELINDKQV